MTSEPSPDTEHLRRVRVRYEFGRRLWLAVVGVVAGATLIASCYGVWLIRGTQQTGSPVIKALTSTVEQAANAAKASRRGAHAAVETNKQLLDCLQPSGECYKRSQAQTTETIGSLNAVTVAAASCAVVAIKSGLTEPREIRLAMKTCVVEALANDGPTGERQ